MQASPVSKARRAVRVMLTECTARPYPYGPWPLRLLRMRDQDVAVVSVPGAFPAGHHAGNGAWHHRRAATQMRTVTGTHGACRLHGKHAQRTGELSCCRFPRRRPVPAGSAGDAGAAPQGIARRQAGQHRARLPLALPRLVQKTGTRRSHAAGARSGSRPGRARAKPTTAESMSENCNRTAARQDHVCKDGQWEARHRAPRRRVQVLGDHWRARPGTPHAVSG